MIIDHFQMFRPHPWHGLAVGPNPPETVNAFIEITPFDLVKYEVDKLTGYLRVDRPQRTSSQPPALYGFIPQTLCGDKVRMLSPTSQRGDGDPLDICVISERPISKSEVILNARPVGGLQMVDHGEADDKIIAVLESDYVWGHIKELTELPAALRERLQHYFETYKYVPGTKPQSRVEGCYGRAHALRAVEASMEDYRTAFTRGAIRTTVQNRGA